MTIYHNETNLRLEIEKDPTGLPNLVQNPSGEKGTWFWPTTVANTFMTVLDSTNPRLRFRTTVSQAAHWKSDFMPVAASRYVAARFDTVGGTTSHTVRARFEWYNSSKVLLSSSAQTTGYGVAFQTNYVAAVQAPANTAYVKIRFDLYNGTGTTNPSANAFYEMYKVMVTHAATSGGLVTSRTNLIGNPSFETNITGWTDNSAMYGESIKIARSTAFASSGVASLAISGMPPSVPGNYTRNTLVQYTDLAIQGGYDYTVSAVVRPTNLSNPSGTGNISVDIMWFDASMNYINTSGSSFYTPVINTWMNVSRTGTAPSNAAYARARINHQNSLNSSGVVMYLDKVMLEQASSAGTYIEGTVTTGSFAFTEPIEWLNILGPTSFIEVEREGMNIGLMKATIMDALLDPSTSSVIKPGRKIRLRALASEDDYPYNTPQWESLFEGKVTKATADYNKDKKVGALLETRIELFASDNMAILANQSEANGVATLNDIAYLMEGAGVPWNINTIGGNQVTSATVVSYNPNAYLTDQIEIARSTNNGFAFAARNGVLTVMPSTYNTYVTGGFSDDPADMVGSNYYRGYQDIDVSFSTEECINHVTVKWLRYNVGSGQTQEISYGPYLNQTSIDTWGARSATFTIHGATENSTNIANYAQAILDANSTPEVKVNSLRFKVRDGRDLNYAIEADLFSKVDVMWQGINYTPRIGKIKHTITPTDWFVDYEFKSENTVPAPTWTPSPPFYGATYDTGWITPTLLNGWQHFDTRTVQYRRVGNQVWLRGVACNGTVGATMFTLPTDCRPASRLADDNAWAVLANSALGAVAINGDGSVRYTQGSNGWVFMNPCTWVTG